MEKVIVLLASYNGEKYLRDQLDSLINQTYKNIVGNQSMELILLRWILVEKI